MNWKVLTTQTVFERPWLKIRQERVRLAHGAEIEEFHVIESTDWTGIVALTDRRKLVLVEQYRHGISRVGLELPAGIIEPGETPRVAAERELLEETGYHAPEWQPLITVATEPSRHTSRAHFFVARGAECVAKPSPEPSEDIRVTLLEPEELLRTIGSERFTHGVHIAAVLLAARLGHLC
jgi:8-oxo-dGTP pyrophosphatase MutT (NUDIX family)